MKKLKLISFLFFASLTAFSQEVKKEPQGHTDINKFSQMYAEMATPNMFRTASGAPGPEYYQQRADYKINLEFHLNLHNEEIVIHFMIIFCCVTTFFSSNDIVQLNSCPLIEKIIDTNSPIFLFIKIFSSVCGLQQ